MFSITKIRTDWVVAFVVTLAEGVGKQGAGEVIWAKKDEVTGGGGSYKIRSCAPVLTKYSGDQIENEIGGACSMYGGSERCIQGSGAET